MRNIQLIKPIKRMKKGIKIQKRIMDIEEDLECVYTTLETKEKGLRRFRFLISKKILVQK